MNSTDHTTHHTTWKHCSPLPRPNGMTLKEWRTRDSKPFCEANCGAQPLTATVSLFLGGLPGVRASSFPNPVLAPPFLEKVMTIFAQWYSNVNVPRRPYSKQLSRYVPRTKTRFSVLTIGSGELIITRKYFWNEHIYADASRRSNVYDSQKPTFCGEMA